MKILMMSLVLAVMAGCTTFHPKPLSPSETASAFEARTLDSPDLKAFLEEHLHREISPRPPKSWDFMLLTLVALSYHPDLDVARAQWEMAKAEVITAGQRPNPRLTFVPKFVSNAASGASPWILDFPLEIPLETAGKRGYRIAQAQDRSAAARLQIATVAWQARSRLLTRLLDLYAATQAEILLQQQQAVQEAIVKVLDQRLAFGEVSLPDVTQAHLALDRTRLSLREAYKQLVGAREQLAEALGLPVGALEGAELSFDGFHRFPLATDLPAPAVQRQALLSRPDLLGLLAEYAGSQSALQLEIAKQYPDIQLGPGYEFDQGDHKWSLGVSVSLPVFNRNQGPVAEAEARRTETAARFSALQARVIGELAGALAGYQAALQIMETAEALVSARKGQLASVQSLFNAGEVDRLALHSAQLELEDSALSRLDALVKAQQSLHLLEDAMQRPLDPLEAFAVSPAVRPRAEETRNP
jgi:cobalt-zinc-cadmium efflux system outer membrane protein